MLLSEFDRLKGHYRLVIVGAGPAGLAAANALRGYEDDVLVVDSGPRLERRDHRAERELTTGFGGAGLYSDGKFSFFPSATALWTLNGTDALKESFAWLQGLLGRNDLPPPPFENGSCDIPRECDGSWKLKDYYSMYLPLEARKDLIARLVQDGAGVVVDNVSLSECHFDSSRNRFELTLSEASTGNAAHVRADFIIFATGRMGPIELARYHFIQPGFKRLEVGFRIEQSASQAFFEEFSQLDPKLTFKRHDRSVEWRTFCACREGEIVYTNTAGLWTVSGRSDCAPSGRTNIGFNTRILDPQIAARVWPTLRAKLQEGEGPFKVPLLDLLSDGDNVSAARDILGDEVVRIAREGVAHLVQRFPALLSSDTYVVGPSLEGVGWYPSVSNDLSLPGVPACIAGDACGMFRGLSGALVSGYFCALKYLRREARFHERPAQSAVSVDGASALRAEPSPNLLFVSH